MPRVSYVVRRHRGVQEEEEEEEEESEGEGYPGSQAGGDALREGPWDEMEKEKLASLR